jgi:hypothetical protein
LQTTNQTTSLTTKTYAGYSSRHLQPQTVINTDNHRPFGIDTVVEFQSFHRKEELHLKCKVSKYSCCGQFSASNTNLFFPFTNNQKIMSTKTTTNKFGLAIVGCGQIATHHLDAISSRLQGKIVLRGLCDPSAERRTVLASLPSSIKLFESGDDPKQFRTLDDLIADSDFFSPAIDIIFIAVPHDLHETLALQALAQDKIVVLEKPLAPTLASCDKLIAASEKVANLRKSTNMLIIAEQSPYWESVALARNMIADGAIGRVVTAAAYYYESMRDNITSGSVDEAGDLGWRGSIARAGGGIAIDGGLHWIRPLRGKRNASHQILLHLIICNFSSDHGCMQFPHRNGRTY